MIVGRVRCRLPAAEFADGLGVDLPVTAPEGGWPLVEYPTPAAWSPKDGDTGIMYGCSERVGDFANNGNGWDYVDGKYLQIRSTSESDS